MPVLALVTQILRKQVPRSQDLPKSYEQFFQRIHNGKQISIVFRLLYCTKGKCCFKLPSSVTINGVFYPQCSFPSVFVAEFVQGLALCTQTEATQGTPSQRKGCQPQSELCEHMAAHAFPERKTRPSMPSAAWPQRKTPGPQYPTAAWLAYK